ncbi:murein hydrolase activator EnvC [Micromonospora sp. R77]|uniref:murein hydrolase activator EnvC family protein n=1 Tax=Micromonospora sp. R77 TaxID=2925836 RepID=UPI0035AFB24E
MAGSSGSGAGPARSSGAGAVPAGSAGSAGSGSGSAASAGPAGSGSRMSRAGVFGWPVPGPPVRWFDPPPQPWLPGHRGVDLAAPAGAQVRSAGPGVVLFAGLVAGRPVVTVGHADGLRTTYEPVRPTVLPGARVVAGTPLGVLLAGHAGCPAAACLHWGLRRDRDYLDPLTLLGLGPVRLLPLDAGSAGQPWASNAGSRTASRSYSSGVL